MTEAHTDESLNEPDGTRRVDSETGGVTFLDLLIVLAKYKKLLVGLPLAAAIVAALISLLVPNRYAATATLMPPQQAQSTASAMLGQLGALAVLAGGPAAGIRNPSDLYTAMLKSRTVADNLIQRFDLKNVYDQQTQTGARLALESATRISAGKEGLISIEVEDRDPRRAAEIANGYVDELYRLTRTLAVTEASQRRLFFEKQLQAAKTGLANAEIALKKTQETTGLIKLDDQGRAIIEAVARLQAQVAAKEVEVATMRSYATEQNPQLVLAQQTLAGLRVQLAKAERDQKSGGGNVLLATGKIPEAGLEYVRNFREVKYHEAIFELLAKQYEIARIDEARDSSSIQVLDRAVEPERKAKPKRAFIALFTGFATALLVIVYAFCREFFAAAKLNPAHAARIEALQHYFRRRWLSRG
jgi:tyrosine-protein kinase Etk/Wzc